mmetsp:Transcript_70603/g.199251  ORF Transcript_70603/g.199251 Transcript_70603/m.199251 type:complete len:593 (+) Transcript_70603:106-1884(+)
MAANGKPTLSLSALQAGLRKGPSAAKGGPPASPQGVKRPLAAADAAGDAPPAKKVIIVKAGGGAPVAKPSATASKSPAISKMPAVSKTPGAGVVPKGSAALGGSIAKSSAPPVVTKSAAPGAMAKAPVGSVGKATARGMVSKAPAPVTKVAGLVPQVGSPLSPMGAASKSGGAPPASSGGLVAVAKGADGGLAQSTIKELVAAIDAAPGAAKIRSVVRLADAMGSSLQIEHINHFLRALKQKVMERAQQDGVHVPVSAAAASSRPSQPASAQPAPAAAEAAANGNGAVGAVAKSLPTAAPKAPSKAGGLVRALTVPRPPPEDPTPAPEAVPKAPMAKAAAAKPKPPQPNSQAPSSPGAGGGSSEEDLLALVTEIAETPVVEDGVLNEARLGEVLKRLWDNPARKTKDWIAAWQAMLIPVDKQAEALQKFLNMTFTQAESSDRAPAIVAELVKGHKIKMRSVEEMLVAFGNNLEGILALNEDAWHVYAHFMVHVFPKPNGSGWGWSRVGWSWQSWWKFTEQCIQSLEASRSSDVLCMILRLIQEREGTPIAETQAWSDGDKLQRVVGKIAELGACEVSEAAEKLAQHGVVVSA